MSRGDYGHGRTYTAEERAEAVGLATSIGPKRAGEQLGMPGRTIAYWLRQPSSSVVIARVEANIAERLKEAHEVALAAVLDGLKDPRARLGDRAAALRVLGEQRALAEGRATANVHNLNLNVDGTAKPDELDAIADGLTYAERRDLSQYIDRITAEYEAAHPEEVTNG